MAQEKSKVLANLPMWALVRRDCVDGHEFVVNNELTWDVNSAADMQRQVAEGNPVWDSRCPVVRVVPVRVMIEELEN